MKKNIYLFITIIAIIAVTGLQVIWFNRTYALMEDKLCEDINSLFKNTLSLEVTERATKGIMPNNTVLEADSIRVGNERYKKSYNSRVAYRPFVDYCFQATYYRFGIKMNLQKVDSIFAYMLTELLCCAQHNISTVKYLLNLLCKTSAPSSPLPIGKMNILCVYTKAMSGELELI